MKLAVLAVLFGVTIESSQAVKIGTESGAKNFMKMKSKATV